MTLGKLLTWPQFLLNELDHSSVQNVVSITLKVGVRLGEITTHTAYHGDAPARLPDVGAVTMTVISVTLSAPWGPGFKPALRKGLLTDGPLKTAFPIGGLWKHCTEP